MKEGGESARPPEHEPYACVTFKNDTGKIVRGEVMPLTAAKERLARLAVEDPEGRYVLEVMLPDGETDAALPAGE